MRDRKAAIRYLLHFRFKFETQHPSMETVGDFVVQRKTSKGLKFLRSQLILAHERIDWSPTLILGELWRLLISRGLRREILRLLKLQPFDEIVENYPGLALNYVVPNYLARGFTVAERVACFLHHYRRIHALFPEDVLRQLLQGFIPLYEISDRGNYFALMIGLPRPPLDKEGELSLILQVNNETIFSLSFTIVPGWVVKSETAEVLLISHLQGRRGCNSQIRLARKAFQDYSPRGPLLAALQGIADAFDIGEIVAVCATNQKSFKMERATLFKNAYDDFFAKAGMVRISADFYSSPIPIEGKPLASFRGRAKRRAHLRRTARQQVRVVCASVLLGIADRTADSCSC